MLLSDELSYLCSVDVYTSGKDMLVTSLISITMLCTIQAHPNALTLKWYHGFVVIVIIQSASSLFFPWVLTPSSSNLRPDPTVTAMCECVNIKSVVSC